MLNYLIVPPSIIERGLEECSTDIHYSCFHQMFRLTADRGSLRHDDRLDAVAYWVERNRWMSTHTQWKSSGSRKLEKFLVEYVVG